MNTLYALCAILFGSAVGLVIAKLISGLIYWMERDTDKTRIKTAMMQEDYYNQLYEECLTEEMDRKAVKAAKEMSRYE